MPHPDVVVVGGGIVGLACARELAGRGLTVTLLERGAPGSEASTAAAGMLAPLAEVPQPGPLFDACRAARDLWPAWREELIAESGRPVGYDASGALVVALDAAEAARLDDLARASRELGETAEEMTPAEARRRVPALSPDVRRALHLPGDHRVDNVEACAALVAAAEARGVEIVAGAEVTAVRTTAGGVEVTVGDAGGRRRRAGALLLAAGAWSGRLPGLPAFPVRPVRGQMLAVGDVAWPHRGTLRCGGRYAVRRGDRALVGATVEEAGFAAHTTPAGLADLAGFVHRALPGLDGAPVVSTWAGLRPGSEDGLPLVGAVPGAARVWLASGHFRNGILLAPWTARRVADLVTGATPDSPADPFSPARFTDILTPA